MQIPVWGSRGTGSLGPKEIHMRMSRKENEQEPFWGAIRGRSTHTSWRCRPSAGQLRPRRSGVGSWTCSDLCQSQLVQTSGWGISTSQPAAGWARWGLRTCNRCSRRREDSHATTTRLVWERRYQTSSFQASTHRPHCRNQKRVAGSDGGPGANWGGFLKMERTWISLFPIYLGSIVTSKRGWNRHLRMSWKLSTLLWVLNTSIKSEVERTQAPVDVVQPRNLNHPSIVVRVDIVWDWEWVWLICRYLVQLTCPRGQIVPLLEGSPIDWQPEFKLREKLCSKKIPPQLQVGVLGVLQVGKHFLHQSSKVFSIHKIVRLHENLPKEFSRLGVAAQSQCCHLSLDSPIGLYFALNLSNRWKVFRSWN